jgi:multiple sugar transport system ATP-binding protein
MNLLPARLDGSRLSLPMVDVDLPSSVTDRLIDDAAGDVIAGLRPENFEDAVLVGDQEAPGATFTAHIDVIEWLGSELFAHFEVEGSAADTLTDLAADLEKVAIGVSGEDRAEVVARLDVNSEARQREDRELWIDARALHLFDPESGRSLLRAPDEATQPADSPTLADA